MTQGFHCLDQDEDDYENESKAPYPLDSEFSDDLEVIGASESNFFAQL